LFKSFREIQRPLIFTHYHLTTEVQDSAIQTILVPLNVLIASLIPRLAHLRAASPSANGGPFFCCVDKSNVRYWHKADIPLAATNVGLGGKADITVDGPECPLMTQSGHCPDQHEKRVECHFALAAGRKVLGF
jgi:hypothetical protein